MKAWQGKHDEALTIAQTWPATDAESRELRGDLAWYRADAHEAEKWYRTGISKVATVDAWKLWLKALKAKKDKNYRPALQSALQRFPEDSDLKALNVEKDSESLKPVALDPAAKSPSVPTRPLTSSLPETTGEVQHPSKTPKKTLNEGPFYRAVLSGTAVQESQDQSLRAVEADAAIIANRKSLSIGGSQVTRDYGLLSLTDKTYRFGLGLGIVHTAGGLIQSQETTLTGGGSPDPDFSPLRFYALRHELFFSDAFSALGELGARWYRGLYLRTLMIGARLTLGHYHYAARIYNTQGKHNDSSFYLAAAYQAEMLRPEIFIRMGRDAASRPYLFGRENESFFSLGTQLDIRFSRQWTVRALFENRIEEGFHQESLSLALLWQDR